MAPEDRVNTVRSYDLCALWKPLTRDSLYLLLSVVVPQFSLLAQSSPVSTMPLPTVPVTSEYGFPLPVPPSMVGNDWI